MLKRRQTRPTPRPEPPEANAAPDAQPQTPWLRWLDLVPLGWLGLVIYAYRLLASYPIVADRSQVPGVPAAEAAVLPLLAALGLAGIIRYFALRTPGGRGR
jgi:hypothetical protein